MIALAVLDLDALLNGSTNIAQDQLDCALMGLSEVTRVALVSSDEWLYVQQRVPFTYQASSSFWIVSTGSSLHIHNGANAWKSITPEEFNKDQVNNITDLFYAALGTTHHNNQLWAQDVENDRKRIVFSAHLKLEKERENWDSNRYKRKPICKALCQPLLRITAIPYGSTSIKITREAANIYTAILEISRSSGISLDKIVFINGNPFIDGSTSLRKVFIRDPDDAVNRTLSLTEYLQPNQNDGKDGQ
ncbi:hypothetical protein F5Y16DRAFT_397138 [Xylariaceae sp. FL0255]|nr:hypothetical protein F5Y16DRAFT_397138 [Xylariaceae sp. FL0255]